MKSIKNGFLCLVAMLFTVETHALTWSPDPSSWSAPIGINAFSTGSKDAILSYDSVHNQIFAIWVDNTSTSMPSTIGQIFYSIYNGSWSSPLPIPGSLAFSPLTCDPSMAFHTNLGQMFVAWVAANTITLQQVVFSNYDTVSGTWSAPQPLFPTGPNAPFATAVSNVALVYDPIKDRMHAAWGTNDMMGTGDPYGAFFSAGTWGNLAQISTTHPMGGMQDQLINLGYNSSTGDVFALWVSGTNVAYNLLLSGGTTWGIPAMPIITTSTASLLPGVAYNGSTNTMFSAWTDSTSGSPFYSVYSYLSSTWSTGSALSNSFVNVIGRDISLLYDPESTLFLAGWTGQIPEINPTYSIFNGSTWSEAYPITVTASLSGSQALANTTLSLSNGYVFAAWLADVAQGTSTIERPTYSFLFTSPAQPVSNLQGVQKKNDFAVAYELFNLLTWNPSSNASAYNIYSNGTLIATINGSAKNYRDNNIDKNTTTTYTVFSVNAFGLQDPNSVQTVTVAPFTSGDND